MTSKMKRNLAKKATAVLSAIAASSFLGLPALAQLDSNSGNNQTPYSQAPYRSDSGECVPISGNQASNSVSNTNVTNRDARVNGADAITRGSAQYEGSQINQLGNDASQTGTSVFPNQSDPRTGSGMTQTPVEGVGGPIDSSNAREIPTTSTNNNQINDRSQGNYESQNRDGDLADSVTFGNVLASGGATTGGFARQLVESASDTDNYPTLSQQSGYTTSYNTGSTVGSNRDSNSSFSQNTSSMSSTRSSSTMNSTPAGITGGEANQSLGAASTSDAVNPSLQGVNAPNNSPTMGSQSSMGNQATNPCGPGMMRRSTSGQVDQSSPENTTAPERFNAPDIRQPVPAGSDRQ